jgi:hypothetical protein
MKSNSKLFSVYALALILIVLAQGAFAQKSTIMRTVVKNRGTETTRLVFNLGEPKVETVQIAGKPHTEVHLDGIQHLSHPGLPRLPFYSFLVAGLNDRDPSSIQVTYQLGKPTSILVGKLAPCPFENLRCKVPTPKTIDRVSDYAAHQAFFRIEKMGDFRGTPLHRVTLLPHHYDLNAGQLDLYRQAEFKIQLKSPATTQYRATFIQPFLSSSTPLNNIRNRSAYDYLVITPSNLKDALQSWIDFKTQTHQLRFKVLTLGPTLKNADALKKTIHAEYQQNKFLYALIVGGQKMVPNFTLKTTTTPQTPTDLPYFAMGGVDDFVPDVLAGRLVAESTQEVQTQTQKWIQYERAALSSGPKIQSWTHGVGVASNEGSNPSDEEYVQSMEQAFAEKNKTEFTHFAENNKSSAPKEFNRALAQGAMWMIYLGHGDGSSWPSFNQTYSTTHIPQMANSQMLKPIWIDVACQNGNLFKGGAGERLSNQLDAAGSPIGTTAYYGGTVNISWHPPAILARGLTYRMLEEPKPILGAVLQLGHAYLAEQISDTNEVRSNQIWYHLQGDPSLRVRLK